jgi:hypothetical protein
VKRVLVVLVVSLVFASSAGAATVDLDQTRVSTKIGERFTFTSTIRNDSAQDETDLVAHLNVLSSDPGTYVDPEDWSTHRTRYLDPVASGGSRSIRWSVKAVSAGPIAIYVTAVPVGGSGPIAVGPPLRVQVADRRTLNSGGVVPLALAVPAAVALIAVAARRRAHQ